MLLSAPAIAEEHDLSSKRMAFFLVFLGFSLSIAFGQTAATGSGPRFVDNGNGTITDKRTGLMWEKAPVSTTMDWAVANDYAARLKLAGYSDWRLPYRAELRDLVRDEDRPDYASWLNSLGFKGLVAEEYWSGTYFQYGGDDYGWVVDLSTGGTRSSFQQNEYNVWFVRGGQPQ